MLSDRRRQVLTLLLLLCVTVHEGFTLPWGSGSQEGGGGGTV